MKSMCKECSCDSFHIKLYLVMCFYMTDNRTELVAVCRNKSGAEKYTKAYKTITTRTWIDERVSDHALGGIMFGKKF